MTDEEWGWVLDAERRALATETVDWGTVVEEPGAYILGRAGVMFTRVVDSPCQSAYPYAALFACARQDILRLVKLVRELHAVRENPPAPVDRALQHLIVRG